MNLSGKHDWSWVYGRPTPAEYLQFAKNMEYNVPDFACRHLRPLIAQWKAERDGPLTIMDLGASYGIMSALLLYNLSFKDLVDAFPRDGAPNARSWEALIGAGPVGEGEGLRFFLTDISQPAMTFATRWKLCEHAFCLEETHDDIPDPLMEVIAEVDLYLAVGSLAYIGEAFFQKILPLTGSNALAPRFAFGVYRVFHPVVLTEIFRDHGYTLRRIGAPFKQGRRFEDEAEQRWAIDALHRRGVATAGFEDDGYYACEFLVAERHA